MHQIDKIVLLNPASYQFVNRNDAVSFGLIAQEVQEIYPNLVHELNDDEKQSYLGISYDEFIPILIAGMKEQQELILVQQKQIAIMKSELDQIKQLANQLSQLKNQLEDQRTNVSATKK